MDNKKYKFLLKYDDIEVGDIIKIKKNGESNCLNQEIYGEVIFITKKFNKEKDEYSIYIHNDTNDILYEYSITLNKLFIDSNNYKNSHINIINKHDSNYMKLFDAIIYANIKHHLIKLLKYSDPNPKFSIYNLNKLIDDIYTPLLMTDLYKNYCNQYKNDSILQIDNTDGYLWAIRLLYNLLLSVYIKLKRIQSLFIKEIYTINDTNREINNIITKFKFDLSNELEFIVL